LGSFGYLLLSSAYPQRIAGYLDVICMLLPDFSS
jgi:hypothetical protein